MNSNDIKELNTALKGEHMAIEGFDHYIQDMKDPAIRKRLMDIQQQHQLHAMQLSERIQQLGGNPTHSAGMVGMMAEAMHHIVPNKYVDGSIIKTAIEGEEMGLEAYGEIISKLSDPNNQKLAKEMLADCVHIMEELNTYM
jgi:bacterioferritin